ncbi:hypothetical protein [Paenibacillus rubinfantis]|nr:hypothetical protein [Paenibacillus rubinfantis]
MPNNFILMGDVDSEEVQQQKLSAAEEVLPLACIFARPKPFNTAKRP